MPQSTFYWTTNIKLLVLFHNISVGVAKYATNNLFLGRPESWLGDWIETGGRRRGSAVEGDHEYVQKFIRCKQEREFTDLYWDRPRIVAWETKRNTILVVKSGSCTETTSNCFFCQQGRVLSTVNPYYLRFWLF